MGNERLSDNQRKSVSKDSKTDDGDAVDGKRSKRRTSIAKSKGDVGRALRTVYDTTLNEDIPSEFLDLLGKLD